MIKEEAAEPVAWAVVPAEPTYEMATAFKISWGGAFGLTFPERYRAMIAAAPTASAEDADEPGLWRFWNDKAREQAATITALRQQLAEAREKSSSEMLSGAAIAAIRDMLNQLGVPKAAFIDDHVMNGLAWARMQGIEEAARVGYRECAQTRHVKLGDTVAAAIRSLGLSTLPHETDTKPHTSENT